MTDDATPTESGQEQGTSGAPTPKISSTSGDQQTSGNGLDTVLKRIDQLEKKLQESDRWTQPKHDKRIGKLESELGSLRETLGRYGLSGEKVDAAIAGMEYEQLKAKVEQLSSGQGAGNAHAQENAQNTLADQTAAILKKKGIDPYDPEVVELAKKPYDSPEDWLLTVAELTVKRSQGQAAAVAAPALTTPVNDGRGKSATVTDRDGQLNTLYAELTELNNNPVTNAARRAAVRARIQELGGQL